MLTDDQKRLIIDILTEKVVSLKGKNGTEFTQVQLAEIVRLLNESLN